MPNLRLARSFVAMAVATFSLLFTNAIYGQALVKPQGATVPVTVPSPRDEPYPGTIALSVDLTNVNDRVFSVHETIPVTPGELTLLYPQWLPGTHSRFRSEVDPKKVVPAMTATLRTFGGAARRFRRA